MPIALPKKLRRLVETAFPAQGDVTSYSSVQNMVKEVEKNLGTIEILVNNAAGDYVATGFEHLEWGDVEKESKYHCKRRLSLL